MRRPPVPGLMKMLGIDKPIFGFSHSIEVTAAISRAGGLGVMGVARESPDEIARTAARLEALLGDKPYGLDLMFPSLSGDARTVDEARARLPAEHVRFVEQLTAAHDVPPATRPHFFTHTVRTPGLFREQLAAVLGSRAGLIACGTGVTSDGITQIRQAGKLAIALIGSPRHAQRACDAGVDALVAQGCDAGGHTGPIGTFTLVPQIIEIAGGRPVLAAGGIGHGSQIAASLAMGAQGAWLGTAWLTTHEHALPDSLVRQLLAAQSTDTEISRSHSGKPCRLLKGGWTEAWDREGSPKPLPMPYQQALTGPLVAAIEEHQVAALMYTPAGQGVVWSRQLESVADVIDRLQAQMLSALAGLDSLH